MKPKELKIIRKFNKTRKQIEDMIMTSVVEKIAEYCDKKAYKQYERILDINKMLVDILDSLDTIEYFEKSIDRFSKTIDEYELALKEFDIYFRSGSQYSNEIMSIIKENIKEELEELHIMIDASYYINCQKTASKLQFSVKQLLDIITYFANRAVNETIRPYKDSLNEYSRDINNRIIEKSALLKRLILEAKDESKNPKLIKILDTRRMDLYMKEKGFEPIRQGKTSHKIYKNNEGKSIPVPQHSKLHRGLSYTIQKQAL
ncbi:type II toxin-antitoxin system HicA family toxin [Wukongibacter sp. M2B1]|uniref:type II toxin-antitoxin system HicA family toxin n=1 Tax=Wukongibacter sp. M2B1 TaxID=3088895 RepID=UPI003D7A21EB